MPTPHPTFNTGTALITTGASSVLVHVRIAQTDAQRAYGLMNLRSMPQDAGMFFAFFSPQTASFWMKDTLIPLSIAFIDVDGHISKILDMTPCKAAPCHIYSPGVVYQAALEVNRGAFQRWGVNVGDTVHLTQSGE